MPNELDSGGNEAAPPPLEGQVGSAGAREASPAVARVLHPLRPVLPAHSPELLLFVASRVFLISLIALFIIYTHETATRGKKEKVRKSFAENVLK